MAKLIARHSLIKRQLPKLALGASAVLLFAAPALQGVPSVSASARAPKVTATAHAASIHRSFSNPFGIQANADENDSYDISQWQGYITPSQAREMKREVGFVILRAQDGGLTTDSQFEHNVSLMNRYHIPYGVYSYSLYANAPQARQEADALHRRAPNAKFYANDIEENNAGYDLDHATYAWSQEIHKISNRPDVLYSGLYFLSNNFSQQTRDAYNAIWIAAYGDEEPDPAYHYDLWQFTSGHYSQALGRALDESTLPYGGKPLSFWIGGGGNNKKANVNPKKPQRSSVVPLNNATKQAVDNASKAAQAKKAKRPRKARNYKKAAQKAAQRNASLAQQLAKVQNENKLESQTVNNQNKQIKSLQSQLTKANQQIDQLKHQKFAVGPQNAKNKPSKQAVKKANRKPVAIKKADLGKVDPQYYSSKRCHYLEVTNPWGIMLYNNAGEKIGRVYQGTVLKVNGFKKERSHGKTITRAIGTHWGSPDVFTSNKNFVAWY